MENAINSRLANGSLTPEQHQERKKLLDAVRVKITKPPKHSLGILKIFGTTIATLGNISVSLGKAKSRKTFNVSAMVAALLSGKKILNYTGQLPPDKPNILYIDTEQSPGHCHKVIDRILTLAGLPKDVEPEHLFVIRLREIGTYARRDYIQWALEEIPSIGFVVIDGLRDLVRDINSSEESQDIIDLVQKWTGSNMIHIHLVLHLNKTDDNARGQIGTEVLNKAETLLLISKNPSNKAISTVRPMETRDQEFESFSFTIDGNGLPILVEVCKPDHKKRMTLDNIGWENHMTVLAKAFKTKKYSSQKNLLLALTPLYGAIGFQRSETTLKTLVTRLVGKGVLEVSEKGSYTYCQETLEKLIEEEKV